MEQLERREKIWTGIFAIVTIAAAVAEMFANGVGPASFCGMVKDVAGTFVGVMVLFVIARQLMPKKKSIGFEEKLTGALEQWIAGHANMIVRTSRMPQGHENDFGMSMTTDITRFYNTEPLKSDTGKGVGRFLRLTRIDRELYAENQVQLEFFLNAQTYCLPELTPDEAAGELMQLGKMLGAYIAATAEDVACGAVRRADPRTVVIPLTFREPIVSETGDRIGLLLSVIDRMYEAMLVSARRK